MYKRQLFHQQHLQHGGQSESLWDRTYRRRGLVRTQWNTLRPRLLAREREDAGSNPGLDGTVIPPLSHYRFHPLPGLPILHTGSSPWDDRKNCRRVCHGHTHVNDPTAGETLSWGNSMAVPPTLGTVSYVSRGGLTLWPLTFLGESDTFFIWVNFQTA